MDTKSSTKANGTKSTKRGASKATTADATTSDTSKANGTPIPGPTFATPAELDAAALRRIGLPRQEPGPISDASDGPAVLARALGALGAGSTSDNLMALSGMLMEFVGLATEGDGTEGLADRVALACYVASELATGAVHLAALEDGARDLLLADVLAARSAA